MRKIAFIFDLDGTVYRGDKVIPGAVKFINKLIEDGVPYLFVTNRANRTPDAIVQQLRGFEIPCQEETVLTSAQATANYLGPVKAFVIGEKGLKQALAEKGAELVEENPDVVIISLDTAINYQKLTQATRFILADARFVATNADSIIIVEDGEAPEAGAIVAAIESTTNHKAEIVGKPNRIIMDEAASRLNVSSQSCIVVGDFLMTDILAAHNADMQSVLILTGVSKRKDIENAPCNPTWIVQNYSELEVLYNKLHT